MSNRNARILATAISLLALVLLACIKIGGQEPQVTPLPTATLLPTATATLLPPTPTPLPHAEPEVVRVSLCRGLTEDGRPFAETNTFSAVDTFAVSVQVAHLEPQNVVSARWYQEDTVIGLTEQDQISGDAFVGLTLEPQGNWVPGNYKVEVSLDGNLAEAHDFAVIGMAALPLPGGGDGGGPSGGLAAFRSDRLGFAISYPADWTVQEGDFTVVFKHPLGKGSAIMLVNSDPKTDSEQEAEYIYDALAQNISNMQQNASKPQENGWHGIVFTYRSNGIDGIGVLFSKVIGARGYSMVFTAVKENWDAIVPLYDQMWESLEIDGAGDPQGADEVLIVGQVRDVDTQRGIKNALFVILKEGVTVQQFIDSGNDKTLIYDSAQSDADGNYRMNVPVRRGATYEVFAVAKKYKSVVDVLQVPADASNPWTVTVSMQKE